MGTNVAPMRVGVLTGGGDCPGLNAVIRAWSGGGPRSSGTSSSGSATAGAGRWKATRSRWTSQAVRGILPRGGTILGSSRTNPLADSAAAGGGPASTGSRTTWPASASTR